MAPLLSEAWRELVGGPEPGVQAAASPLLFQATEGEQNLEPSQQVCKGFTELDTGDENHL